RSADSAIGRLARQTLICRGASRLQQHFKLGGKPLSETATVLIPGWMHEHARDMLRANFNLVEIPDCDLEAHLTPQVRAAIRGVACYTTIDRQFIDALPNLEIIASYGVGYDTVDAAYARSRNVVVT